jgi:hypothetical protein
MKAPDSDTLAWRPVGTRLDWRASLRDFYAKWRGSGLEPVEPDLKMADDLTPLPASHQAAEPHQMPKVAVAVGLRDSFVTLDQLERLCREEPIAYLVEGLLPAADVHIAVGDSGLGKTPWAYQLGLCVATGRPFLGHNVRRGRVLYFDLENGRDDILELSHSICKHLRIEKFPPDFLVLHDNGKAPTLQKAIADFNPALVIVDTLRAFHPEVEHKNSDTGRFLGDLRNTARAQNCAILLLHHIRKQREDDIKPLEDTPALQWLEEAAGARALINQTNTRIAFDRPGRAGDDAAFVMKYFIKLKGESGPFYLERVCNDDGDPIGYRSIVGVHLLGNPEQEQAFDRLPQEFTFKEAKRAYGRSDDPTRKWLIKCIAVNLVRQVGRGCYERVVCEKGRE